MGGGGSGHGPHAKVLSGVYSRFQGRIWGGQKWLRGFQLRLVSDRSVCYLASGCPVIAQETGFSAHLPTGAGLFTFQDEQSVLQAIDSLRTSYEKHRRKAREIAEEYFDSRKVLGRLLEAIKVQ